MNSAPASVDKLQIIDTGMKSRSGYSGKKGVCGSYMYLFSTRYETNNGLRLRWVCIASGCNAAVRTDTNYNIQGTSGDHMCDGIDALRRETERAKGVLRMTAKAHPELTSGQVIDRVRNNENVVVLDQLPTKELLRRTVNRTRRVQLGNAPRNPHNLDELPPELPPEFCVIHKRDSLGGPDLIEEEFLRSDIGDGPTRTLIFARQKFIDYLANAKHWLIDGTFSVVPELFAQLVIIHARWQDTKLTIPVCYILLPGKDESLYGAAFNEVKILVGYESPDYIYADFEQAIHNAASTIFPYAEIRACNFHMSQNLRKYLGELGLLAVIDNDLQLNHEVKLIRALAAVPLQHVVPTYDALLGRFAENNTLNTLQPFLRYFEYTYMGKRDLAGHRGEGLFPRDIWNLYDRILAGDFRTTNSVEGMHHRLNTFFGAKHPMLWVFIDKLRKFDEGIYSDVRAWERGEETKQRKKWQKNDELKRSCVENWGRIDPIRYLSAYGATLLK